MNLYRAHEKSMKSTRTWFTPFPTDNERPLDKTPTSPPLPLPLPASILAPQPPDLLSSQLLCSRDSFPAKLSSPPPPPQKKMTKLSLEFGYVNQTSSTPLIPHTFRSLVSPLQSSPCPANIASFFTHTHSLALPLTHVPSSFLSHSGGLEALFNDQKRLAVTLPPSVSKLGDLIKWVKNSLITHRHDLFADGDKLRAGILVLVNDVDWELENTTEYALEPDDRIAFISTLHGG